LDIDSRSAITVSELRAAHDVPFGAAPSSMDVTLGGGVGLREMALLMMGSAGPGGLCSELAGQKLGLSAAHSRQVCGILPVTGNGKRVLLSDEPS
ncbi:hypothetical protein POSPLADRAFT_1042040, partial [Postia placenta MAD-698-R-SB12]